MRKKYDSKLLTIFIITIVLGINCETKSPTAPANTISWQQTNGPYGGDVYSIAINSQGHIFVGGTCIYRSTDNGSHWTYQDMDGIRVNSLFIDQFNGHIYAMTKEGLMRSIDNGENWSQLKIDYSSDDFTCFVQKSDGCIFAARLQGVYRSQDNGENWKIFYVDDTIVKALAIHPNGSIYAGTYNGIYLSTDNGENWKHVALGARIIALAINSNGHFFAGTRDGIYRSIDNGKTWSFTNFDTPVRSILINSSGLIFAKTNFSLFRSSDNGDNWFQVDFEGYIGAFAIDSLDHLFIAGRGVFRSTDNGDNWTEVDINIFNTVEYLAVNSFGHIFAVASDNLYRSLDNGNNWERISSLNSHVFSVGISPKDIIFVSTANGIFRSSDNGDSWVQANSGLSFGSFKFFSFNSMGHIFTGRGLSSAWIFGGIYRSIDNGNHWTCVSRVDFVTSIEIVAIGYIVNNRSIQFEQIFAVTGESILTSVDNGNGWKKLKNIDFDWIKSIKSNPRGHLFINTNDGIYRSTDYGATWTARHSGHDIRFIKIDSKGHIYAVTYSGIIRSTNDFVGWRDVSSGLEHYRVQCLTFSSKNYIFAGTSGGGVFRCSDN